MEVGQSPDGLHHRFSQITEGKRCDLCHHQPVLQGCSLIPVKEKITAAQLAELYIAEIVSLHGILLQISSDRGSLFTSRYWRSFQEALGTILHLSTAYHPQSQGQVERVNQVLEDMLRACVISFGKKWEESLPLAKFSYNNSYHASLKMAPYEVLYGRKCRTPLSWSEARERTLIGPDIIQQAEDQLHVIREHLKATQSRQKSNYDRKHREMEYNLVNTLTSVSLP